MSVASPRDCHVTSAAELQDPEKKAKSLVAEINNGRLAMMAIIGALLGLAVKDEQTGLGFGG